MKATLVAIALAFSMSSFSHAEEDHFDPAEALGEKTETTGNDVKRSTQKGLNRTQETFCIEGELECKSKKMKNRVGEGKDSVKDKAKEAKNSLDSDSIRK